MLTPHDPTEDGRSPRQVVACNRKTEQSLSRRWCNQGQQAHNSSKEHTAPNSTHGNVAECLRYVAEEGGEWKRAITGEGPGLATGSDEDGETHEELYDHEERHETQGAIFANGVVVDLSNWKYEISCTLGEE